MARILKRGDRRYQIQVFLGRDSGGKQRFDVRTIEGTKKQAEEFARELQLKFDRGESLTLRDKDKTLNSLLDDWLEIVVSKRCRRQSYLQYRDVLAWYIRPVLGPIAINKLTTLDIQKHYHGLLGSRNLSPQTVRLAHAALNGALIEAVLRWELLSRNPATGIRLPNRGKTAIQVLTPQEAVSFVEVAQGCHHGLIFLFALITGMRPEEYLSLAWTDMPLSEYPRAIVRRTLIRPRGELWRFDEPKTKAGNRVIPLPGSLVDLLIEHRTRQSEELRHIGNPHGLVFTTGTGAPWHYANLTTRYFKPLIGQLNLRRQMRLYDLRHTCATLLLEMGVNAKIVSERLGHSSVAFTLDTYTHVLPHMQEGASDKLENALFPPRSEASVKPERLDPTLLRLLNA